MQLSLQSHMLTDIFTGPSGRSFVFKSISIGSSLILPNISLSGTSIFKSGSVASMPMVTISLQVAPSWGNVITQ